MRSALALTLLIATIPALAQTTTQTSAQPDEIIAQENAYWKSYVSGDTAELSKFLPSDFTSPIVPRCPERKSMASAKLKTASPQVTSLCRRRGPRRAVFARWGVTPE